jgi:hypothetical protein
VFKFFKFAVSENESNVGKCLIFHLTLAKIGILRAFAPLAWKFEIAP